MDQRQAGAPDASPPLGLDDEPFDSILRRADALRAAGDQTAGPLYHAILRRDPRHFLALMGLAVLARARGDMADAVEFVLAALRIRPEDEWSQDLLLDLHRDRSDWDAARELADRVLAARPQHPAALMTHGLAARAGGDRMAALAWFSLAAQGNQGSLWASESILAEHRDHGRWPLAQAMARIILASLPDNHAALVTLGLVARASGDDAEARRWFESAAGVAPENAWSQDLLLEEHRRANRWPEADAAAETILARRPDHLTALITRGLAAQAAGDRLGAVSWLKAASSVAPDNPWPRDLLMSALCDAGDDVGADTLAEAVLARDPTHLPALMTRALNARKRGDMEKAVEMLRTAAAAAPENAWPRNALAETLRNQGAFAEAEAIHRVALDHDPADWSARLGLARLHHVQGDLERALAVLTAEAAPMAPIDALMEHARLLLATGDPAGARPLLERVLAARPKDLPALLTMAQAEQALQRHQQAREALDTARMHHPDRLEPLLDLAALLWQAGDAVGSDELLRETRERFPEDSRALEALASQARQGERPDKAVALLRAALAVKPRSLDANVSLVGALLAAGEADAAQLAGREAEALLGPLPAIRHARVVALFQQGHWPEALALARTAVTPGDGVIGLRLWQARLELLLHGPKVAETTLAGITPSRAYEQVEHLVVRGLAAGEGWHLDDAAALFRKAGEAKVNHHGLPMEAVRIALLRLDIETAKQQLRVAMAQGVAARQLTGRSGNISQSLAGQMIDEFSLDTRLLGTLQELRGWPAEQRIAALGALVRENHDSTLAACQLVLAMRQADRFVSSNPDGVARIPQRIGQYWNDPEPPADVLAIMDSWLPYHPGFTIERFHDATAWAFLCEHQPGAVAEAFRIAPEPAMRADIFRLGWLAARGGIYVDADDRCHGSILPLLPAGRSLLLYLEDWGSVGNNIIAAAPGEPIIAAALAEATGAIMRDDREMIWLSTGPGMLTRCFARAAAAPGGIPGSVTVVDRQAVHAVAALHCLLAYKSSGKHWIQKNFVRQSRRLEKV